MSCSLKHFFQSRGILDTSSKIITNLNIYFSRLIPQVAENAAASALSEAKPLAWRRPTPKAEGLRRRPKAYAEGRRPTPKACRRAKSRGREGGDSRGKRVGESIPDGWRPEASPPNRCPSTIFRSESLLPQRMQRRIDTWRLRNLLQRRLSRY